MSLTDLPAPRVRVCRAQEASRRGAAIPAPAPPRPASPPAPAPAPPGRARSSPPRPRPAAAPQRPPRGGRQGGRAPAVGLEGGDSDGGDKARRLFALAMESPEFRRMMRAYTVPRPHTHAARAKSVPLARQRYRALAYTVPRARVHGAARACRCGARV